MNSLLRDAGASGRLDAVEVLIHPLDAAEAGVQDGAAITIRTEHGTMHGTARVDEHLRRGVVSAPHGWPGDAHVGRLLTGSTNCDPLTGMVHQSGVPVTIEA
jgi:anaerobic selenocysteine-containing dehydrogenase